MEEFTDETNFFMSLDNFGETDRQIGQTKITIPDYFQINCNNEKSILFDVHCRDPFKILKRKYHTKYSKDNIICKIKVFFISSLLNYINSLIRAYFQYPRCLIRKIHSSLVNSKSYKRNYMFFNTTLSEYFQQRISSKYTRINVYQNIINIRMLNEYPFFKKLFKVKLCKIYDCLFVRGKGINQLVSLDCEMRRMEQIIQIKMNTIQDLVKRIRDEKYKELIQKYSSTILETFHI